MDFHDNILGHLDTPQIFNMRVMKDVQNKFKVTDYQLLRSNSPIWTILKNQNTHIITCAASAICREEKKTFKIPHRNIKQKLVYNRGVLQSM